MPEPPPLTSHRPSDSCSAHPYWDNFAPVAGEPIGAPVEDESGRYDGLLRACTLLVGGFCAVLLVHALFDGFVPVAATVFVVVGLVLSFRRTTAPDLSEAEGGAAVIRNTTKERSDQKEEIRPTVAVPPPPGSAVGRQEIRPTAGEMRSDRR